MAPESSPPLAAEPPLTDLVRILDVAAELRADREMASREFAVDETRRLLRERLLASAKLTGDTVTPEEVDAAIERYFQARYTFHDPPQSLPVVLANVRRRGRLALAAGTTGLALVGGWGLFNSDSGLLSPTARQTQQVQVEQADIRSLAGSLTKEAADPQVANLVREQLTRLQAAAEHHDLATMQEVRQQLLDWQTTLDEAYEIRIVSHAGAKAPARPGEKRAPDTGFNRQFQDKSGKRLSGHYLIVEARDRLGRVLLRSVTDAETGRSERVRTWAELVPDSVFERIHADKQADGILDETQFAVKQRGQLTPQIVIPGIDASSPRRQLTHW